MPNARERLVQSTTLTPVDKLSKRSLPNFHAPSPSGQISIPSETCCSSSGRAMPSRSLTNSLKGSLNGSLSLLMSRTGSSSSTSGRTIPPSSTGFSPEATSCLRNTPSAASSKVHGRFQRSPALLEGRSPSGLGMLRLDKSAN